jgi:hypothetical protein
MKSRIARYLLAAVGFMGIAGTPALFAGDFHRDYRIRRDERRIERDCYRHDRRVREYRRDWR